MDEGPQDKAQAKLDRTKTKEEIRKIRLEKGELEKPYLKRDSFKQSLALASFAILISAAALIASIYFANRQISLNESDFQWKKEQAEKSSEKDSAAIIAAINTKGDQIIADVKKTVADNTSASSVLPALSVASLTAEPLKMEFSWDQKPLPPQIVRLISESSSEQMKNLRSDAFVEKLLSLDKTNQEAFLAAFTSYINNSTNVSLKVELFFQIIKISDNPEPWSLGLISLYGQKICGARDFNITKTPCAFDKNLQTIIEKRSNILILKTRDLQSLLSSVEQVLENYVLKDADEDQLRSFSSVLEIEISRRLNR